MLRRQALAAGIHSDLTEHKSLFKEVDLPLAGLKSNKILHFRTVFVNAPDAERVTHQQLAQFSDIVLGGNPDTREQLLHSHQGRTSEGPVLKCQVRPI